MVCAHCVDAVKRAFTMADIPEAQVCLGLATVPTDNVSNDQLNTLDRYLNAAGFERIDDPEARLIERVKLAVMHHVRHEPCHYNLSECLHKTLGIDYPSVSKLFSSHEGRTIEKYHIAQRVEYVKELLYYRELNISEIADKAGYSSVAHLSRQFKSVTGLTPSEFIKNNLPRIPLNLL